MQPLAAAPLAVRRSAQALAAALPTSLRAHWQAEAWQRPAQARCGLWHAAHCVGSIHPELTGAIGLLRSKDGRGLLQKSEHVPTSGWGDGWLLPQLGWQAPMAGETFWRALAQSLRDAGLHGPWRDEALAVRPLPPPEPVPSGTPLAPLGAPLGFVERGAVRVLGIATQAVHLIALTPEGDFWVQQRSLSKANDPGLWDTTMGGMVGGHDTWASALARETWEEAGLDLDDLDTPHAGGAVQFSMPSRDGKGLGWMRETIAWTACVLPAHLKPINQDGEVAQFAAWSPREVAQGLAAGAFTLEASCVLADWCDQVVASAG